MRPNPVYIDLPGYYYYQLRTVQAPPFIRQLPYTVQKSTCSVSEVYTYMTPQWYMGEIKASFGKSPIWANNDAIMKLRDELGNITLSLEEMAQARSLIAALNARLFQLFSLTKSLPKFLNRSVKVMAGVKKRNHRADENELAMVPSAWLEWWFCYKPTVNTIIDLTEFLQNGEFSRPVKVSASCPFTKVHGSMEGSFHIVTGKYRVGYSGLVSISNPNAGIASALNATSIAESAWALVPMSWAADYLANVSDVLGNFKTYPGFSFGDWSTSVKISSLCDASMIDGLGKTHRLSGTLDEYGRTLIPGPPLSGIRFTFNPMLNLQRASYLASATALILKSKLR